MNNVNTVIKILLVLIGLTTVVLWFSLPSGDDPDAINSHVISAMFFIMYILLAIAVVTTLAFGLTKWLSKPGSIKKALFAIGGLVVVVAISYGLSSGNEAVVTAMAQKEVATTESTVKMIGMGLNVFFILTLIAVLLMVLPGVKRMFIK